MGIAVCDTIEVPSRFVRGAGGFGNPIVKRLALESD